MKNFAKNKKIVSIILITSFLISFLLTCFYSNIILTDNFISKILTTNFLIRNFLIFSFLSFISAHLIFNINDLYKWLYKSRYYLFFGIIVFAIIFELNNSSIELWSFFDTNFSQEQSNVIFGKPRLIRIDEWNVYTPMLLSQNPDY